MVKDRTDEDRTAETPHERYVAQGKCPSVTPAKTWCNGNRGHHGPHYAQRVPTPGQPIGINNPARITWPGSDR